MKLYELRGIIAATFTPFHRDGSFNPAPIERYASFLSASGIKAVFIGGTTGESHSMSLDERRALTRRWMEVARGSELDVIVHVGSNCLADARDLASQADDMGAAAISAVSPAYFKPRSVASQLECCAQIASAAPELTFFHYDIPGMTGVSLSMPALIQLAQERIPSFGGLKFSNPDLMMFQQCLRAGHGRGSVAWGCDESLLGALVLGCQSAVGSTYNFCAPMAQRLWQALEQGDLAAAREDQYRIVRCVELLNRRSYLGSAKVLMQRHGIDLGPMRLPNSTLDESQSAELLSEFDVMGYFDWLRS